MDRNAVAMVLEEIGVLLDLHGERSFRARAFQTAARALLDVPGDIVELARTGKLADVRGFGPATAEIVREIVETGTSGYHHTLRERTPPGLFECLQVPGLGAKRMHQLHTELGIDGLDALEKAAQDGRIAALKGYGEKTQAKILEGIGFVKSTAGRRRQPAAFRAAEMVIGFLESLPETIEVKLAGELRRRMETVDGVDVVVSTKEPEPVLTAFEELPGVARTWRPAKGRASARFADGLEIRLVCATPTDFAVTWLSETGSAAHIEALQARAQKLKMRLDASGLWKAEKRVRMKDEAALYRKLELEPIPPELREGQDEVEAAATGRLPDIVSYADLRGCFHCHTTWSDGKATLQEMAEACIARGWRYWGVADHSKAAYYAGGLTVDRIAKQHEEVDEWNASRGDDLWIFKGIEADILADGRLDYHDEDEDVLARFDYVVGSVHSAFGLSEAEQTRRLIAAVRHPRLTILGHPTGRLLLSRNGYALDLEAVIDAAAESGTLIEINSSPARLDMDWRWWRMARKKGIVAAINPDAHSVAGLADVEFGVGMARKAGLPAEEVLNTWELERVRSHFAARKERG